MLTTIVTSSTLIANTVITGVPVVTKKLDCLIFDRTKSLKLAIHRKVNYIDIDNIRYSYIHGDNKSTRTILYFHGSGGCIRDREFVYYLFDKLKVNWIAIEYPGNSGTLRFTESTLKGMKYAIDSIYHEHKFTRDIIWGTSIGGGYALKLGELDNRYKYIIHCVSFFNMNKTVHAKLNFTSMIYGYGAWDSLSLVNNLKITQKLVVVHATHDELFLKQYCICNYKNVDYVKVDGTHAVVDFCDKTIEEICKSISIKNTKPNQIVCRVMRDQVLDSILVLNTKLEDI